ncbi:unnamed protein product, partial [marine sediment metagenome]
MSTVTSKIDDNKKYYLNNKEKIIKQFNSLIKTAEKVVLPIYGNLEFDFIEKQARIEFENILSRLPYVGG